MSTRIPVSLDDASLLWIEELSARRETLSSMDTSMSQMRAANPAGLISYQVIMSAGVCDQFLEDIVRIFLSVSHPLDRDPMVTFNRRR